MGTVTMHNAVSVDGFIADENDQVGPLFDYYGNGDIELTDGGEIKVSQASAGYLRPIWAGIGSMVIGRHLFDLTNGWEGTPPAGDHVVVVSHRPRPRDWEPSGFHPFTPGSDRRRTTSSATWHRRSRRPGSSQGSAPSP